MAQFKDLEVGQTFDFIDDEAARMFNSFYDRCTKLSAQRYKSLSTGLEYRVGVIGVNVFHVGGKVSTDA